MKSRSTTVPFDLLCFHIAGVNSIIKQLNTDLMSFISLDRGVEMTTLYRAEKESILDSSYQNQGILPICETYNRSEIDTLLAREGCEAIRVYLGMDEDLKVRMLLVGVNDGSEDILPSSSLTEEEYISEEGQRCPDTCPPSSPLNS